MKPSSSVSVKRARPILGTLVEIRISEAAAAIEPAFEAVQCVHRLMSCHEPGSDVSRINRAAAGSSIEIHPWTYEVLSRAKEIQALTDGLFDCGHLSDLELRPGSAVRIRRRLGITLDGIAKGYAVDRAVEALRTAGVTAGVVNAGGDLRVFGEQFEPVHVRHPASPGKLLHIGHVREAAVASSAAYFSASVVDPRTMKCVTPACGVTVIAADCVTADALTKPCLLEPDRASAIAARFDAQAMVMR